MAVTIGTNIASLGIQRALADATGTLSSALGRLSSGQRINSAGDDAASLAVADKLETQGKIYGKAISNLNDGISLMNIAEAALTQLQSIALRQRELASQAANGTYSFSQRGALDDEADALVEEFNRIVASTTFNGISLFSSNPGNIRLQAGSGSAESLLLQTGQDLARNVGDSFAARTTMGYFGTNTIGDVNGDGKDDIVYLSAGSTGQVLLSDGDGTFTAGATAGLGSATSALFLSDVNNDSKLDLITGAGKLLLGNGDGTFNAFQTFGTSASVVCDQNGDGNVDIIGATAAYMGNGDGSFNTLAITGTDVTRAGDVNGDGYLDLFSWSITWAKVSLATGSGTFAAAQTVATYVAFNDLETSDVNGDGYADLLLSDDAFNRLRVLLSDGDGTFTSATTVQFSASTMNFNVADLNGDGKDDLLMGVYGASHRFEVRYGDGEGGFGAARSFSTGQQPDSLIVGDITGDGRLDVMSTNSYDSTVSIHLATGSEVSTIASLNLRSRASALAAISTIDETLERISDQLGSIGATQSRTSVALNVVQATRENLVAAGSRIMDADVAEESARMIRAQVLQQAATAVLAQANQSPKLALALLGGIEG